MLEEGLKLVEALTASSPMLWVILIYIFFSIVYVWVSWAGHKRNADRIIAHNERLGFPIRYEYGWLGVRIIPMIVKEEKETPDRSSKAPPEGESIT